MNARCIRKGQAREGLAGKKLHVAIHTRVVIKVESAGFLLTRIMHASPVERHIASIVTLWQMGRREIDAITRHPNQSNLSEAGEKEEVEQVVELCVVRL